MRHRNAYIYWLATLTLSIDMTYGASLKDTQQYPAIKTAIESGLDKVKNRAQYLQSLNEIRTCSNAWTGKIYNFFNRNAVPKADMIDEIAQLNAPSLEQDSIKDYYALLKAGDAIGVDNKVKVDEKRVNKLQENFNLTPPEALTLYIKEIIAEAGKKNNLSLTDKTMLQVNSLVEAKSTLNQIQELVDLPTLNPIKLKPEGGKGDELKTEGVSIGNPNSSDNSGASNQGQSGAQKQSSSDGSNSKNDAKAEKQDQKQSEESQENLQKELEKAQQKNETAEHEIKNLEERVQQLQQELERSYQQTNKQKPRRPRRSKTQSDKTSHGTTQSPDKSDTQQDRNETPGQIRAQLEQVKIALSQNKALLREANRRNADLQERLNNVPAWGGSLDSGVSQRKYKELEARLAELQARTNGKTPGTVSPTLARHNRPTPQNMLTPQNISTWSTNNNPNSGLNNPNLRSGPFTGESGNSGNSNNLEGNSNTNPGSNRNSNSTGCKSGTGGSGNSGDNGDSLGTGFSNIATARKPSPSLKILPESLNSTDNLGIPSTSPDSRSQNSQVLEGPNAVPPPPPPPPPPPGTPPPSNFGGGTSTILLPPSDIGYLLLQVKYLLGKTYIKNGESKEITVSKLSNATDRKREDGETLKAILPTFGVKPTAILKKDLDKMKQNQQDLEKKIIALNTAIPNAPDNVDYQQYMDLISHISECLDVLKAKDVLNQNFIDALQLDSIVFNGNPKEVIEPIIEKILVEYRCVLDTKGKNSINTTLQEVIDLLNNENQGIGDSFSHAIKAISANSNPQDALVSFSDAQKPIAVFCLKIINLSEDPKKNIFSILSSHGLSFVTTCIEEIKTKDNMEGKIKEFLEAKLTKEDEAKQLCDRNEGLETMIKCVLTVQALYHNEFIPLKLHTQAFNSILAFNPEENKFTFRNFVLTKDGGIDHDEKIEGIAKTGFYKKNWSSDFISDLPNAIELRLESSSQDTSKIGTILAGIQRNNITKAIETQLDALKKSLGKTSLDPNKKFQDYQADIDNMINTNVNNFLNTQVESGSKPISALLNTGADISLRKQIEIMGIAYYIYKQAAILQEITLPSTKTALTEKREKIEQELKNIAEECSKLEKIISGKDTTNLVHSVPTLKQNIAEAMMKKLALNAFDIRMLQDFINIQNHFPEEDLKREILAKLQESLNNPDIDISKLDKKNLNPFFSYTGQDFAVREGYFSWGDKPIKDIAQALIHIKNAEDYIASFEKPGTENEKAKAYRELLFKTFYEKFMNSKTQVKVYWKDVMQCIVSFGNAVYRRSWYIK